MALRPATDDDYAAMFGTAAPGRWFGTVWASEWLIEGLGLVYLGSDGRWWLGLARAPGVGRTRTAHAEARKLLARAEGEGITVHAMCDPAFDGTERWLIALGFRASDETIGGITVWTR